MLNYLPTFLFQIQGKICLVLSMTRRAVGDAKQLDLPNLFALITAREDHQRKPFYPA